MWEFQWHGHLTDFDPDNVVSPWPTAKAVAGSLMDVFEMAELESEHPMTVVARGDRAHLTLTVTSVPPVAKPIPGAPVPEPVYSD